MSRRLTHGEEAIWRRVAATVKAYRPLPEPSPPAPPANPPAPTLPDRAGVGAVKSAHRTAATAPRAHPPAETLDARWDRRLQSGKTRPDRVIDLHGLTRAAARERLRTTLFRAHAQGERLILVITGKGALPGPEPADLMGAATPRGAIRAELPRWLGEPDLSAKVAAVRQASPSQGGLGAVWLVLRRHRTG